ncbi:hypothetical protein C3Y98_05230 [Methylotenera oryzisoli]|uniref:IrrE N-terminal-like domain-containing protein n=1 Tax=Methylotenera oryzisoli TaxID=2080758 RepID=A0A4Y9VSC7_9PROT|nr:hypothetical protein [Methylotenera oryzisoli]TFW71501.1 hypothetical protein C3Y98_05230 [Methylotenera oryzisoli]
MDLDLRKIKITLENSQALRDTYFDYYHNGKPYISVNDLLTIVETNLEKKVTLSFHEDHYKDHSMHSFVAVNSDGSFEICLLNGMTNCWNRFSLCKELFHVVLDCEDARNSSLPEHLIDFRSSIMDGAIEGSESSKSEILTEFAAMQFLFPYQRRLDCLKEIEARKDESIKSVYEDMAVRFRIPRLLVEDYLSPRLIEFFDSISWTGKSDSR